MARALKNRFVVPVDGKRSDDEVGNVVAFRAVIPDSAHVKNAVIKISARERPEGGASKIGALIVPPGVGGHGDTTESGCRTFRNDVLQAQHGLARLRPVDSRVDRIKRLGHRLRGLSGEELLCRVRLAGLDFLRHRNDDRSGVVTELIECGGNAIRGIGGQDIVTVEPFRRAQSVHQVFLDFLTAGLHLHHARTSQATYRRILIRDIVGQPLALGAHGERPGSIPGFARCGCRHC